MRVCAWPYCNLLCHVLLISLGGLFFSDGKQRRGSGGGEEGGAATDVIYERIKKSVPVAMGVLERKPWDRIVQNINSVQLLKKKKQKHHETE